MRETELGTEGREWVRARQAGRGGIGGRELLPLIVLAHASLGRRRAYKFCGSPRTVLSPVGWTDGRTDRRRVGERRAGRQRWGKDVCR